MEMIDVLKKLNEIAETKPELVKDAVANVQATNPQAVVQNAVQSEPAIIYHKTCYDFLSMSTLLEQCGFKNVIRYDWRETEHSHIDDHSQAYFPHMDKQHGTLVSLNVEAVKC